MLELANKLGLTAWVEEITGRIKWEGKTSEVRRVWAVSGADLIPRGNNAWDAYIGGEFMGCIVSDGKGYAYSFTTTRG